MRYGNNCGCAGAKLGMPIGAGIAGVRFVVGAPAHCISLEAHVTEDDLSTLIDCRFPYHDPLRRRAMPVA